MGKAKRKTVKIIKKKPPTIFPCPACGEETVKVKMDRYAGTGLVQCTNCGLRSEYEAEPVHQIVDMYCMFTDSFRTGKLGAADVAPSAQQQPGNPPAKEAPSNGSPANV